MNKEEIINFIYYLCDKIDPIYLDEVSVSIKRFIEKITKKL